MRLSEFIQEVRATAEVPEREKLDATEKKTFSAFGWDPEEFRRKSMEIYYQDFLDQETAEFLSEREKYEDDALYELSSETFMREGPNCYAFAMQWPLNPALDTPFSIRPVPGNLSHGFHGDVNERSMELLSFGTPQQQKEFYSAMMKDDAESLEMSVREVDGNYRPKDGEWIIALATTENLTENPYSHCDFHFYRKGNENIWYHKPGTGEVENTDAKGNLIFDPAECNRGAYRHFLGYFAISGSTGKAERI